jgi:NAD(P)-dependent dehydrogenase (short-subunit alcohol dehydrogenase family)
MDLKGTAAVVTGGASGLGAAVAQALAKSGAKVTVFDRQLEPAQKAAKDIGGIAVECDVTSDVSAEAALVIAEKAHGPARILINCAGILGAGRILGREGPMALSFFEQVLRVNLLGTFNLLRLGAARMQALPEVGEARERGIIINTASIAAYEGQIGQAAYAASKGGVVSLTLPAARELAKFGIRVMALAAAGGQYAPRRAGFAGGDHSLPAAPGETGRICCPGAAYYSKLGAERGGHPPGWRPAPSSQVSPLAF